jgi:hypothetical protein
MQYTSNFFFHVDYKVHQIIFVMHKTKTGKRNQHKRKQIKMKIYDTLTIVLDKI